MYHGVDDLGTSKSLVWLDALAVSSANRARTRCPACISVQNEQEWGISAVKKIGAADLFCHPPSKLLFIILDENKHHTLAWLPQPQFRTCLNQLGLGN